MQPCAFISIVPLASCRQKVNKQAKLSEVKLGGLFWQTAFDLCIPNTAGMCFAFYGLVTWHGVVLYQPPSRLTFFFFCLTLTRPVWMLFYFIRLQRQDLFVCTHCSSTTAFIFVFTCCVCLETFSAVLFRCIFAACNWRGGNAISSQDGLSSCSKFGNWPVRAYLKSTLMETVYISISLPHGFYFAGLFIFWILCYCTMLFSCPLLPPKL